MRRRRQEQRGFALLFVFVMAASVAILLYRELPRVAFEAQRNKEQRLIECGEQYSRAIQLYVRKFKKYPQTIEELETTNQIRFLRRKYNDPMSGKGEWRLIHVGPGGVFIDSLVHPPPSANKEQKAVNTFTYEAPAIGATVQPGQAGPAFPQARPSERQGARYQGQPGQPMDPSNPQAQLPPQAGNPATGFAAYANPLQQTGQYNLPPGAFNPNQPTGVYNPNQPPGVYNPALPPGAYNPNQPTGVYNPNQPTGVYNPYQPTGAYNPNQPTGVYNPYQPPGAYNPNQPGAYNQNSPAGYAVQNQPGPTGAYNLPPGIPGGMPVPGQTQAGPYTGYGINPLTGAPPSYPYSTQPGVQGSPSGFGQPGTTATPGGQPGQNQALAMINQILTTPRAGGLAGAQQPAGQQIGGGIAGVASLVERTGIKIYNEKDKYNEWEFLYDLTKDATGGAALGINTGNQQQQQQKGSQGQTPGAGQSGFGAQPGFNPLFPGAGAPPGFGPQPIPPR